MRLSRYIFLVIICFLSSKFAIAKDYGEKIENRLDGKVKRGWNEQMHVEVMTNRHTKLATLFNYLYLQQTFHENKTNEVIAKLWSVPDGSVIDKFLSLDFDKFKESMNQLESARASIQDNNKTKVSFSEAETALKQIQEISNDERRALKAFGDLKELPGYLHDSDFDDNGHHMKFVAELASKVLAKLEQLNNPSLEKLKSAYEKVFHGLSNCIELIESSLAYPERLVNSFTHNSMLTDAIKVAGTVDSKLQEFDQFSNYLNASLYFFQLVNHSLYMDTFELLTNVLEPPSKTPFVKFIEKHGLGNMVEKDQWMEDVLGGDASKLIKESFGTFQNEFNQVSRATIPDFLDFSRTILNNRTELKKVDFTNLFGCLNVFRGESRDVVKYIIELPFEGFFENLLLNNEKFKTEAPRLQEYLQTAEYFHSRVTELLKLHTVSKYEEWRKSQEFQNLTRFTNELIQLSLTLRHTEKFRRDHRMIMYRSKWKAFQSWIQLLKLLKYECDPLFEFKPSNIEWINRIPEAIATLEKSYLIYTTPMSLIDLQSKLKRLSKPGSETTHFKATNKENLLALTQAITDLRTISDIDKTIDEKMIGKVIEGGDEVVKAIGTLTVNKERLKRIWRHWPETKDKLKEFRKSISKIMEQVRDEHENSLVRVGLMYFWIAVVRMEGIPEFAKYRESLRLFDPNPAPELEEALKKLEVPMSMDWDLVHMNFRKMPEVMRELQKDFDCFFDENKCPKKPEDRSAILMERYRKNQENFYKIDLRKQLLSLAYGWSMAIVPPGLLLLTWLWIIGKFNKHYYGDKDDDYETESDTDDSDSDWDDGYTSTDSNESNTAYN